jgi:tetratricopeptide (TPR) repeat protein
MRLVFALMVSLLLCAPAFADPGAGDVRAGNAFYNKGEFQHAIQRYEKAAEKSPADPRIEYNLGAAAYQAKDYDAAIEHFQKSLLTDDDKFRRDVHFNLGDAFYRVGINREDKDIDQSIKRLESSLASFEKARALDPKDKQTVENYEFVKQVLEQFKQKKEQQQKSPPCPTPKQDQQQQDQQKDQSQQDQQKSEEQKNQDQKDQEKQDQEKKDQEQKDQEKQDQEKQDQEKKDQEQKDQQDKQDDKGEQGDKNNDVPDKEQKDQPPQQNDQGQPDKPKNDQNNGASGQTAEGQISSQKDANDMVDDFERNELPKGLLNFIRKSGEARPVDKDW